MNELNAVIRHYDALIDEGNNLVHDLLPLREYMDKRDGQTFIDGMELSKEKSVLEIGVGTGRTAVTIPRIINLSSAETDSRSILPGAVADGGEQEYSCKT